MKAQPIRNENNTVGAASSSEPAWLTLNEDILANMHGIELTFIADDQP